MKSLHKTLRHFATLCNMFWPLFWAFMINSSEHIFSVRGAVVLNCHSWIRTLCHRSPFSKKPLLGPLEVRIVFRMLIRERIWRWFSVWMVSSEQSRHLEWLHNVSFGILSISKALDLNDVVSRKRPKNRSLQRAELWQLNSPNCLFPTTGIVPQNLQCGHVVGFWHMSFSLLSCSFDAQPKPKCHSNLCCLATHSKSMKRDI